MGGRLVVLELINAAGLEELPKEAESSPTGWYRVSWRSRRKRLVLASRGHGTTYIYRWEMWVNGPRTVVHCDPTPEDLRQSVEWWGKAV